jgi:type II secretory pathway pseudopilin PulG
MRARSRQSAVTLTEMTVVIAVVALLVVFGLPAVRAFINSFESEGGARAMISAALASARAIAARERHSVGIRFQKAYEPSDPLKAAQYMIFVINDPDSRPHGTDLANGFRAVEGIEPMKLPDSIGVMDLRVRTNHGTSWRDAQDANDQDIRASDIDNWKYITDTTSFSIVFSPSGRLVVQKVHVRNRHGTTETTQNQNISKDDIFNTESRVTDSSSPIGMFIQDDYAHLGLGQEWSRKKFVIYDRDELKDVLQSKTRWRYGEYLDRLRDSMIYINPYTGTLINR